MNDRTASILLFDQTLVSVYFCLFVAVAVTSIVSDRQLHQTLDEFKKLKIARVELGVNTYVSAASATTTQSNELSLEKRLLICRFLLIVISLISSAVAAALLVSAVTIPHLDDHHELAFFPWLTYDVFPGYLMFTAHLLLVLWLGYRALVYFPWLTYDLFPGYLMFTAHLFLVLWFRGTGWVAALIVRDDFDARFVFMLTLLLMVKCFFWIVSDRVDAVCSIMKECY